MVAMVLVAMVLVLVAMVSMDTAAMVSMEVSVVTNCRHQGRGVGHRMA